MLGAGQDYLQLFSDAGWEYLGKMSGWGHYFRKEAREGETLEIFTDVESKIAKYKRVLTYLSSLTVIFIVFLNNVWFDYPYSWWFVIRILYLLVMGGQIYSIIRLVLRIRQLRRL